MLQYIKHETRILTEQEIDELESQSGIWTLVDLKSIYRKLNKALQNKDIQEAFHIATHIFHSLTRWEAVQFPTLRRFPQPLKQRSGTEFLIPSQADYSDWRWDQGPGRPPRYFDFVCARACHWMAVPNLLLAQTLFPDVDWTVLSSQFHTSVVSLDQKLLFDLNYYAMNVTGKSAVELLIKGENEDEIETMHFGLDDPYTFDELGTSLGAERFFEEIDSLNKTDQEKLALIKEAMEMTEEQLDQREGVFLETPDPTKLVLIA